jgi:hypothetical protein
LPWHFALAAEIRVHCNETSLFGCFRVSVSSQQSIEAEEAFVKAMEMKAIQRQVIEPVGSVSPA